MSTTYPFQDDMAANKINPTDLPAKTQKLIEKFNAETDEEKKEALADKIFVDVDDYIEDMKKQVKEAEKKAKLAQRKKDKQQVSVAGAPTATPPAAATPAPSQKDSRFMNRLFGRK